MLARPLLAFAALAVSAGSSAQETSPANQHIKLTIARDGEIVATPALTMQVGRSAVMTVGGRNGYALRASISPDARVPDGRKVDLALYFLEDGSWVLAARPSFTSGPNNSVRMTLPDASGRTLAISATLSSA